MLKKVMALLIAASLLAGCADAIPDPEGWLSDDKVIEPDWITEVGEITVMYNATTIVNITVENGSVNNTTIYENTTMIVDVPDPVVWINTNITYGWLELREINYTATHLSFVIINNTVIFNNYSFDVTAYLVQDDYKWNSGFAPELGNATLYVPSFPFDITINYTITYRVWNGR